MKTILALALAALAAAEPEAKPEADAYYGYGYGHGLYYGKREAEAEPYYGYAAHAVAPVVSTYATAPVSTVGIAPAAIPAVGGAYAGAGRYVANSAGTVHVAKREAEADPYYFGGYYGRSRGLGYRSY